MKFQTIVIIVILLLPSFYNSTSFHPDFRISTTTLSNPELSSDEVIQQDNLFDNNLNTSFLSFNGIFAYTTLNTEGSEVIIRTADGSIVNQLALETGVSGDVEPFNQTSIMISPFAGNPFIWDYVSNQTQTLPFQTHHDLIYRHDSQSFLTLQTEEVETDSSRTYLYDTIVEYSLTGKKLWQFNLSNYVSHDLWNGDYYGDIRDLTHANSIEWHQDSGKIWVNLRNTDQIYQIDYNSGSIDWILGQEGNFSLYTKDNQQVNSLFHRAHDLQRTNDTTFLLFDNEYQNPVKFNDTRSRLIEINLDLDKNIAVISKEWIAPKSMYSPIWGSIEQLPNNNFIASFGASSAQTVVEINMTSMEYSEFPLTTGFYSITIQYTTPQILMNFQYNLLHTASRDLTLSLYGSYSWDIDEKVDLEIYVNQSKVSDQSIIINDFWMNTPVTIDIDNYQLGNYNLTILLTTPLGIQTSFSTALKIQDYFFNSPPLLQLEQGLPIELEFSGIFRYNTTLSIFNQSHVFYNSTWDNGSITIDKHIISEGNHTLGFILSNSSHILEQDQIDLTILPKKAPLINISSSLVFEWGDPVTLSIGIEESSEYHVRLYTGGIEWFVSSYDRDPLIEISLPQLFEGFHRFEFEVVDELGLLNSTMIVLEIISPSIPKVIEKYPDQLDWGQDSELIWEVHGVTELYLYRDDILLEYSEISLTTYIHEIQWRVDEWKLEEYNLSLIVSNGDINRTFSRIINVDVLQSDPFASSVVNSESSWVVNPDFALGEPDGKYAEIRFGYENGRLTLDLNTKISQVNDSDLSIYASGGTYRLLVSSTLDGEVNAIGIFTGVANIELSELRDIRYIIIEYISGQPVLIDAVEATNFEENSDQSLSSIDLSTPLLNFTNRQIEVTWNISYYLGVSYQLTINNVSQDISLWDGGSIFTKISIIEDTEVYSVVLFLYDILGSSSKGQVQISVESNSFPYAVLLLPVIAAILVIFILYRLKR